MKIYRRQLISVILLLIIQGVHRPFCLALSFQGENQSSASASQTTDDSKPLSQPTAPSQLGPTDLNTVAGAANESLTVENNQVKLAPILPQYEVPESVETGVMVGADTLRDLLKKGNDVHLPYVSKAYQVANFVSTFHKASEIGLNEGQENMKAELYVLEEECNQLHDLIKTAQERGTPPDQEQLWQLNDKLQRLQRDFSDHSTSWEFFKRSVLTEASNETLLNEAAVFGKEYGLKPFLESLLGRFGGWLYDRLGLGSYRRWLWKEASPNLRALLGKNAWKKFSNASRLAFYEDAAEVGGKKIGGEILGQIDFKFEPPSFEERVRIISERVATVPPRLPPPQIVATNAIQAIAVLQNLALAPAAVARAPLHVELAVPAKPVRVSSYENPSGSGRSSTSEWQAATSQSTIQLSNTSAFRQAQAIDRGIRGFDSP